MMGLLAQMMAGKMRPPPGLPAGALGPMSGKGAGPIVDRAPPQYPPVAFPQPSQPLPPNTPGPDVGYPGGIQNFWSNNGRTFNIPAAAALAQRPPMGGAGPMMPSDWRDSSFPNAEDARRQDKVLWKSPIGGRGGNATHASLGALTGMPFIGADGNYSLEAARPDNFLKNITSPITDLFGGLF